ncbi:restriction endonuclease [Kitasatospora sp. NPDC051914]|uniref:restriction endonuclease n=1 Tax=Kitasatospora sp. NPDC051914 TaxID=3154945 RepID=UPI0034412843
MIAAVVLMWLADLARAAGRAAAALWPLLVLVAVGAVAALGVRVRRAAVRRRAEAERAAALRMTLRQIDAMTDREFEFAARDLLLREGCTARQVGRQGDQAADVVAQHPLHGRIVVQCKHTRVGGKVGSQVMYQVKGTAGPVHGADVAVVVTNGGFTRDARAWGDAHGVHWVDRERLRRWAEHGTALPDLLDLPARAGRSPLRRGVA